MKRILTVAAAAGIALGGVAAGNAAPGPTDDNDNNLHGLCTAFFNGSANGQANKRQAGPFVQLAIFIGERDMVDNDGDDTTDEEGEVADPIGIFSYCGDTANNPKGIGGQPDDPNTTVNDGNGKNGTGNG